MALIKKFIGTSLFVLLLFSFAPWDDEPLEKLLSSLQKWTEENPQEKVYIHMDKPYYVLSDTIWFKAYLTKGSRHELSNLSEALYVDLITEKDSIVKTLKLPVNAGMSMGDFILGDELQEGNYRIRAYTQWMRNADEDYFFDHTFTVGTLLSSEIISSSDFQYTDIKGKTSLIATLKFTKKDSVPLVNEKVEYDVVIRNKTIFSKSGKTNSQGILTVDILDKYRADLRGAYIRTKITSRMAKVNKMISEDFPIRARAEKYNIQFFPEGGSLINGVSNKIAFKAIGVDGKGLAVRGKVYENGNREILDFETLKFGMGSFVMIPQEGKAYSAKCIFPDSTEQTIVLPQASNDGYALSVYQPNEDSLLVRIRVSPKSLATTLKELKSIELNLIAQVSGETIIATPLKITQTMTSFWLGKDAFPTGIAQFSLFSSTGEPLNERIAFIDSKDQMNLNIISAKNSYKSKEKIELKLQSLSRNEEPTRGNFSVTVIDETKVPFEEDLESTIFSNLLLTSDLKGYIERPNYYFINQTEAANKALDNLMLTQGYRRFEWKELTTDTSTFTDPGKAYLTNALFKPERAGLDISGIVKSLNGEVAPRAKLTLMALKAGIVLTTTANADGRFKFEGLVLRDSIDFSLQARTENNGDKVEIVMDSVSRIFVNKNKNIGDINNNISSTLNVYTENARKQEEFYEKTGQLNKVQRLREVRISASRKKDSKYSSQGNVRVPEGHADNSINLENEKPGANLGISLRAMMPNVKFTEFIPDPSIPEKIFDYPHYYNPSARKLEPMKIILDGRELSRIEAGGVFNNTTLDPADIAKVDVVFTNASLIAMLGGPAMMIYTKKQRKRGYNPSIVNISPKGFNKVRTFYSPKYESINSQRILDFRSTIYWNASLKTLSDGIIAFDYFNADSPGKYKVIIEGISSEGELGRLVYRYSLD